MAIEETKFAIYLQEGPFDLRDYQTIVVAEVTVAGTRRAAGRQGLRQLAAYVAGANRCAQQIILTPGTPGPGIGERIARTAPVMQVATGGGWTIRIAMPSCYALDQLPVPNDPTVHLRTLPPSRYAVIRFSGLSSEANVAGATAEVTGFARAHKQPPHGPASVARYDGAWTPWFLRRNEVMVTVEARV